MLIVGSTCPTTVFIGMPMGPQVMAYAIFLLS